MNEDLIFFESVFKKYSNIRKELLMKNFQCCATCRYFRSEKKEAGIKYFCSRLGYETKTNYQFNCWNPREDIKKRINEDQSKNQPRF
jgi:hypothetical protein